VEKEKKNWGKNKKFREGQTSQVLDDLFFEFIKLANKLRPKIIVAENVKGILMGNAKGYVNLIIKKLEEAGYRTQIFLLNSARMGVPQKRERVFFISTREDLNFPKLKLEFNEKLITYGEIKDTAYKTINKDTMLYQRWLRRSRKDNSLCDTIERTENGKISSFNTQFVKDNRIPNTLAAGSLFLRFDVPASISDRDIKLIQTFPQDYNFLNQNVQYICGMSVPPVVMKKISEQIKIQLLDKMYGKFN